FGLNATGEVEIKNNWPTTVPFFTISPTGGIKTTMQTVYVSSIMADASVHALGVDAQLHGQVWGNGDFDLTGSESVGFSGLGGSAAWELKHTQANPFSFTSHVQATYTEGVVRATLGVDFSFGVDVYGHVTYSGYGSAKIEVYAPNHGWNVTDWEWQSIGTVGVGVNNSEIWFNANGSRYDIYLPH